MRTLRHYQRIATLDSDSSHHRTTGKQRTTNVLPARENLVTVSAHRCVFGNANYCTRIPSLQTNKEMRVATILATLAVAISSTDAFVAPSRSASLFVGSNSVSAIAQRSKRASSSSMRTSSNICTLLDSTITAFHCMHGVVFFSLLVIIRVMSMFISFFCSCDTQSRISLRSIIVVHIISNDRNVGIRWHQGARAILR